jgi:AcrR family transcriptional regulator
MSPDTSSTAAAVPVDWHAPGELEFTPILCAARDAFYDAGYHGTSVRDIARRMGVTVPALYYHHQNKEAILFTLLDTSVTRLTKLCTAALADANTAEDRFLNLVECIVVFMVNVGKTALLHAEMRSLSLASRKVYTAKRHVIETMLVDVIEEGVDARVFNVTTPAATARALLGMYQAIPTWYKPDGPLKALEVARAYKDISAHAVGGVPDVIARAQA